MHIDWFVFFSQIVNLLILMFLLKKFLFGRIVRAMDSREAKIGAVFAEAEKSRHEAEAAAERRKNRLNELEANYEQMINKSRQEAEAYQERLLDKAREEVDFLKARWTEALKAERVQFLQELRHLAGNQVYAVSRRVLKDLADLELEERIVEILMERIASLNEEDRIRFQDPIKNGGILTVSCAFDIPASTQSRLDDVLRRFFAEDVEIAYERSDNVLSGCELRSGGHKIAWSIKDYLDSLEEAFNTVLCEVTQERRQKNEGVDHEQYSNGKG